MQPSRRTDKTRKLLIVDPYPRNNPYHLTASERRAVWFEHREPGKRLRAELDAWLATATP